MLASRFTFDAIGTSWSVETSQPLTTANKLALTRLCENFDKIYSRFRSDSLITQISKSPGTYVFPDSAVEIFELYENLYGATGGAVSPCVGHSLAALGYDMHYSLKPLGVKKAPDFRSVIKRKGATLSTKRPVTLDVGAVGKGYLVDQLVALVAKEHSEYIVDGSGDMKIQVKQNQRIGLENPNNFDQIIGYVDIDTGSICASAVNRRKWGDNLHHVVDGRTGQPTEDVIATWVLADKAFIADGLATALFFVSPDKLRDIESNFRYIIIRHSGEVSYSSDLPGKIFS